MDATRHPRIKICCIMSEAEARMAVQAGAHAIGLVSHMPSGPGMIRDELIARIAAATQPAVTPPGAVPSLGVSPRRGPSPPFSSPATGA